MATSSVPHDPVRSRQCLIALAERRHASLPEAPGADDRHTALDQLDPPAALLAARNAGGDGASPDAMLTAWANAHPARDAVDDAIGRLHTIVRVAVAVLVLLSLVAGYGAASAALAAAPSGLVNVPAVLGVLLGIPTLLLGLWLVATLLMPRAAPRLSIGGAIDWFVPRLFALVRRLGGRLGGGRGATATLDHAVALDAVRRDEMAPGRVRWSFGVVTHAAWLAFTVGALTGLLVTFALRERQFSWESTILSHDQWERAVLALGWLPSRLGLPMPDSDQVAAARFSPAQPESFVAQDDAARRAWASLVLVSVVVYSALPRTLLLGFCLWRRRRGLVSTPLPIDEPPLAQLLRTIDSGHDLVERRPAPMPVLARPSDRATAADRSEIGPPAIVGIELAPPPGGWPPSAADGATDLGIVEVSRSDRDGVVRRLAVAPPPARLVIVAPLALLPDRGLKAMLTEMIAASRASAHLVLSGGAAFRARDNGAAVERRVAIWHDAAVDLGLDPDAVTEIDLDRLTARSSAALRSLVATGTHGSPEFSGTSGRQLERAVALIVDACAIWCDPARRDAPTMTERAALAGRIAALYDAESGATPSALGLPSVDALRRDPVASLRTAAERVQSLLPPTLRLKPRWIGAGGVTGALACVGVALATGGAGAGAALLAAPYLAGLGAIAGQLMAPRGDSTTPPDEPSSESQHRDRGHAIGEAVVTATMHAVLLETQGDGETTISRALAAVAEASESDDVADTPSIDSVDDARAWLDGVRHRVGLAMAGGTR